VVEPPETVEVHWVKDVPPSANVRVSDYEHVDPARGAHYVWWRHRWCVVSEELMAETDFNEIDRRIQAGELGLLWREDRG
jgi:hypothetical protein